MPQLLELRPQQSLMNSNFDGYKLSLTEIPTVSDELQCPVDRVKLDVNQYSILHAKLYSLHNHLIGDNCPDNGSVYFIDKAWKIRKYTFNIEENRFKKSMVWEIPSRAERKPGDYNISLKLASAEIAVIGDGTGFLYVLDRNDDSQWKILFSGEVIPDQNFIVTDARLKSPTELHLLLLGISRSEVEEHNISILHWIILTKKDESWNQTTLRQLTAKGYLQYTCLEVDCEDIYVASDSGCKFTLDSEKEIKPEETEEEKVEPKYSWTQTKEDLSLKFKLADASEKKLVKVETKSTNVTIKYDETELLIGDLYQCIDPDLTTWTLENNVLNVTISKTEHGLMWPEIVKGDKFGEYIVDPEVLGEVRKSLSTVTTEAEVSVSAGTTFNSQQVEDCDFDSDKETYLERLSSTSHKVTHKVDLGSHQILLTCNLDSTLPPALGVRSDVDVCMWQPLNDSDEFKMEHKGTLFAMGYIQASKEQMKFFACSPNMNYSVVSEGTKNLFLYCQSKSVTSGELKNRTTGRRIHTIAQQQLVNLVKNDDVLGIWAFNSLLYVLQEKFITVLKL